jgi:hypothetical protein
MVENAVKGKFPEWGAEIHEHSKGDVFYHHLSIEDFITRKNGPAP